MHLLPPSPLHSDAVFELVDRYPRYAHNLVALGDRVRLTSCSEREAAGANASGGVTAWRNIKTSIEVEGQRLQLVTCDKETKGVLDGVYTLSWGGADGCLHVVWHMQFPSRISRWDRESTIRLGAVIGSDLPPRLLVEALTVMALGMVEESVGPESSHGVPFDSRRVRSLLAEAVSRVTGAHGLVRAVHVHTQRRKRLRCDVSVRLPHGPPHEAPPRRRRAASLEFVDPGHAVLFAPTPVSLMGKDACARHWFSAFNSSRRTRMRLVARRRLRGKRSVSDSEVVRARRHRCADAVAAHRRRAPSDSMLRVPESCATHAPAADRRLGGAKRQRVSSYESSG